MNGIGKITMDKYRRQFILSENELSGYGAWNHGKINNAYFVYTHPDLNFSQVSDENNQVELSLMGYLIDPTNPDDSDLQILENILAAAGASFEKVIEATFPLGGRWILIFSSREGVKMFSDPCGLRTVYFTNNEAKEFMAASQPGIINDHLNFTISAFAQTGYLETKSYTDQIEYWIPSGVSLYDEISHLIPNHYLDVNLKKQIRFWPSSALPQIKLKEGVNKAAELIENLVLAASQRFNLALAFTAGIDSRVIMAATRKLNKKIRYYTLIYYKLNELSPDIRIPKKLLAKAGRQHEIYDCSGKMDDEFREIYMNNVDTAHAAWGNIAFGIRKWFPENYIAVKGDCSGVTKKFYYKYSYPDVIDAVTLAKLARFGDSPFAHKAIDVWLSDTYAVAQKYHYEILDLYYWEFRTGSWQATSQLEWDIVQEVFAPFNCRALLIHMLGVDVKYRSSFNRVLYKRIIRKLWPLMLTEPVNPRSLREQLFVENMKRIKANRTYILIRDNIKMVLRKLKSS
jgi:hypothetical protein